MNTAEDKAKPEFLKKLFSLSWIFPIVTPLVYFPAPQILAGHPWKVELTFSFLLFLYLIWAILNRPTDSYSFSLQILQWIIAPLCAFALWSGVSLLWADSSLSVIHHTLVWCGYIIFFIVLSQTITTRQFSVTATKAFCAVIGIIALLCVIEYSFSATIGETFGFRYARFAEINAAALPLFFALTLKLKRKNLLAAIVLVSIVWLAILFSMSRGSFLAAIVGLSIFCLLRFSSKINLNEKKRLIVAVAGLVLIFFLTQFSLTSKSDSPENTVTSRFTVSESKDAGNSVSANIRFLFWATAFEMFSQNPVKGVGADNFGLEFNKYRAIFSSNSHNKTIAEQQESLLPERAHNEYLQILTELGITGALIFAVFVFGIVKLGFIEFKSSRLKNSNILSQAAFAGIIAFLFSSLFSSFSFRLMQNGIVFFFLLAILLKNYFSAEVKIKEKANLLPSSLKPVLLYGFAFLSFSLICFSVSKAASQFLVYSAEKEADLSAAQNYYDFASKIDPANGSANYSYGLRLLTQSRYQEASEQLRKAIDKGLNSSTCYSYLASAQSLNNNNQAAQITLQEAVEIFPFSTFVNVRYASLLKDTGRHEKSDKYLEIAKQINRKQAESWWIFINNGSSAIGRKSIESKDFVAPMDLQPQQAFYAVLTEREIRYPAEKFQFAFDK